MKTTPPPARLDRSYEREEAVDCSVAPDCVRKYWRECPAEFTAELEPSLIADKPAFKSVLNWDLSFPGFVCVGPGGTCKTRACWEVLYKAANKGVSFRYFKADSLCERYWNTVNKQDFLYNELRRPGWPSYAQDIVFIDELDKAKLGQFGGLMFEVVNLVYEHHLPCLITTNKDKLWWQKSMDGPSMDGPNTSFVRRLFGEGLRELQFHA